MTYLVRVRNLLLYFPKIEGRGTSILLGRIPLPLRHVPYLLARVLLPLRHVPYLFGVRFFWGGVRFSR